MGFLGSSLFTDSLRVGYWKGQKEIAANTLPENRQLNESQFAIVASLSEMAKRAASTVPSKRIPHFSKGVMVEMPPGLGKSHVIAGLALLTDYSKVVIVYSSEILKEAEHEAIEELRSKIGKPIETIVGIEGAVLEYSGGVLLLIDEADTLYIDKQLKFEADFIVALTATPITSMKSNEKTLLMDYYELWLLHCGFTRACYDDLRPVDSVEDFLAQTDDWAKLIYAEQG